MLGEAEQKLRAKSGGAASATPKRIASPAVRKDKPNDYKNRFEFSNIRSPRKAIQYNVVRSEVQVLSSPPKQISSLAFYQENHS